MSKRTNNDHDRAACFQRNKRYGRQINRYLKSVAIFIRDDAPQTREALEHLIRNPPGNSNSIRLVPFLRHQVTNYDAVCNYVYRRWGRVVPMDDRRNILHPKCRKAIGPYLGQLGADDLLDPPHTRAKPMGQ